MCFSFDPPVPRANDGSGPEGIRRLALMKYIMALGHGVDVRKREPLMAIMAEAEARGIIMISVARALPSGAC